MQKASLTFRCLLSLWLLVCTATPLYATVEQDSLLLVADSIVLRELTVTAVKPLKMRGDTLVYDVAAFPVPEGSRLRELLRRLPGVEVTADGAVRAQGKTITCLLLNGRDFFAGNHSVVLDNLPVDVLLEVQVYDRVQEDEEDTGMRARTEHVMDLTTEPDNNRGWFTDFTGGGGYDKRFLANANANRFGEVWQNMVTLSADNLPQSFGIGESFYEKVDRTLQSGDVTHRNVSVVVGRKKGVWETTGSAYYTDASTTTGSENFTETILSKGGLFSRSSSKGNDRSHNLMADLHLERHDSMTTISIDPRISFSKGHGESNVFSASSEQAFSDIQDLADVSQQSSLFNRQASYYTNRYRSWNAQITSRLRRRLSRRGQTLTATASWELNDMSVYSSSLSETEYFRQHISDRQLRYSDSPTRDWQARLRVALIEPLGKQIRLKAEYGIAYRHEKISQPVYTNSDPEPSSALSKDATYEYLNQTGRLLVQWSPSERLFFSVGAQYNPVQAYTRYVKNKVRLDTLRTLYKWTPELNFYYRSDKGWNLSMQYEGNSRQPSLLNILPIEDDGDPLHIHVGNPGLKPSFVHSITSTFFLFEPNSQTQFNIQANGQWEYNAMADVVEVVPSSGVRRLSVENVNGCWQIGGNWTVATSFMPDSHWMLDCQGDVNIVRRVGFQERQSGLAALSSTKSLSTFSTRQILLRQYLALQWQPGVLSMKPYGFFSYNGLRAHQINISPADLWLVGLGMICRLETGNGWSLAVDASRQSRRGYIDAVDNDDEWLIDLEMAYAFMKGRAAEVRLQACDLLRQHSLSRSVTTATERIESTYPHSITHYILLSFTYRFSLMGK